MPILPLHKIASQVAPQTIGLYPGPKLAPNPKRANSTGHKSQVTTFVLGFGTGMRRRVIA